MAFLSGLRDPRCVDLLIGLLGDDTTWAFTAWNSVGDGAERALAELTGQTFARDKARWIRWWEGEAKRVLPDVPPVNSATRELDLAAEARRKRHVEGR